MNKKSIVFFVVVGTLFIGVGPLFAQNTYDKYAVDAQALAVKSPSTTEQVLNSPAYLWKWVKTSIKKAAVWVETYHVPEKVDYVYTKITDYGFYPFQKDIQDEHGNPSGVAFNYGLYETPNILIGTEASTPYGLQYRKKFPLSESIFAQSVTLNSWAMYGTSQYSNYGIQGILDGVGSEDTYVKLTTRFHENGREDFFDQGPNYSIADGYQFDIKETAVALAVGHRITEHLTGEVGAMVSVVDVSDAKEYDKRNIGSFTGLDGREGGKIGGLGASLEHDTRDNKFDPKHGGLRALKASYHEGLDGDNYGYMKYKFDVAEYTPLGELLPWFYYDSVVLSRIAGEFTDDINNDGIPFYDLARLGGSETIRGYQYNRFWDENSLFYTLEYRYNIWSLKEYKVDATSFVDCGWIFDEVTDFEWEKFKIGGGLGLRIVFPGFVMTLEGARSSEGMEFFVKAKPKF